MPYAPTFNLCALALAEPAIQILGDKLIIVQMGIGLIDAVNFLLHHQTFPIKVAWNVIEHETDLEPIPEFLIPNPIEDLMDPVGISRL